MKLKKPKPTRKKKIKTRGGNAVLVTDRDKEMMTWINSHGFVIVRQICAAFEISQKVAYRRLSKLIEEGYVKHERIFVYQPGAYSVTSKGVELIQDELPPLKKINLGTYEHDLKLVDLSLFYRKKLPDAKWVSERQLRIGAIREDRRNGGNGLVGIHKHFPDGHLIMADGTKIAIELELSAKANHRITKIIQNHIRQRELSQVYYFVEALAVKNAVTNAVKKLRAESFIQICAMPQIIGE